MVHNPQIQDYIVSKHDNITLPTLNFGKDINILKYFIKEDTLPSLPRRILQRLDSHQGLPFFKENDTDLTNPTYWRGIGINSYEAIPNVIAKIKAEKKRKFDDEEIVKDKILARYRQIHSNYQKKSILGILTKKEKEDIKKEYLGLDFKELFNELRGVNRDNEKDILDPTRSDFDINKYYDIINDSSIKPASDIYNEELFKKVEKLVDQGKIDEHVLYRLQKSFDEYKKYEEITKKEKQMSLIKTPQECIEVIMKVGNEIYRLLNNMKPDTVNNDLAIITRLNNIKQFFGHLAQLSDEQIEVIARRKVDEITIQKIIDYYYNNFAKPYIASQGDNTLLKYDPKFNKEHLDEPICITTPEKKLGIETITIDKYYGLSLNIILSVPDIHVSLKDILPKVDSKNNRTILTQQEDEELSTIRESFLDDIIMTKEIGNDFIIDEDILPDEVLTDIKSKIDTSKELTIEKWLRYGKKNNK